MSKAPTSAGLLGGLPLTVTITVNRVRCPNIGTVVLNVAHMVSVQVERLPNWTATVTLTLALFARNGNG